MVLSASAAAEGQAGQAAWLERLRGILELGRNGVLILVPDAKLAQLRLLMRSLWAVDEHARVVLAAEQLAECADNELIVLALRRDDASWLNRNRPLFVQRRLRVVLWGDEAVVGEMRGLAPDFFDWISHVVLCPFGVPEFTRRGLELGSRWYPGIVWRGGLELGAVLEQLGVDHVDEPGEVEYPAWVEFLAQCDADFVRVGEVSSIQSLRRIRWAMAETRFSGRIVLDAPDLDTPGWFPVDARQRGLVEFERDRLELGVLLEGEEEALRLATKLGLDRAPSLNSTTDQLDRWITEAAQRASAWPSIRRAAVSMRRAGPVLRALFAAAGFDDLVVQLCDDELLPGRQELALLPGIELTKVRAAFPEIAVGNVAEDDVTALMIELALLDWGPRRVASSKYLYDLMRLDPSAGAHLGALVGRAVRSDQRLGLVKAVSHVNTPVVRARVVPVEDLREYVPECGETLGWSSSTVSRVLSVAFARTHEPLALAKAIFESAQHQLGGQSLDLAKLSSLLAALVGGRDGPAAARPWLERACGIADLDCDLLAALDLLDGRTERGLSLLEPMMRADRCPNLRERQLVVLALRMNGESERAADLVERWTDHVRVEDFEFGPPRGWLTELLQRELEAKRPAV